MQRRNQRSKFEQKRDIDILEDELLLQDIISYRKRARRQYAIEKAKQNEGDVGQSINSQSYFSYGYW